MRGIALGQRHGAADAADLRRHQPLAQLLALLGEVEQALAAVRLAFLLVDIALVDQFLQHAAQALLGDAQDVEQLLHRHAGVAADEVNHPVMRPAEAELPQDLVRIGHEIAIGEEQQLDQRNRVLVAQSIDAQILGRNYVSHIDIFFQFCYVEPSHNEMLLREPPSRGPFLNSYRPDRSIKAMTIIPFDQRDGWIWFNGEIVPWKEAKVHVLTHGLHYGSSVFEGERAYGGVIFKSTRTFRSACTSRPRSWISRSPIRSRN